MYECDKIILNNVNLIKKILIQSAEVSGATIIKSHFHEFNPYGVSGIIVIAESHFSIHTWPEYGYCAIDIFTCGDLINNNKAVNYLKKQLKCKQISVLEIKRGTLYLPDIEIKHKPDIKNFKEAI